MDIDTIIQKRRAYRALSPVTITDEMVSALAESARLAPSCFNKQPWRFVFIRSADQLEHMHTALSQGNAWAKNGSMIIAVVSTKEFDCVVKSREYFLFDTGMASALLMLKGVDMGLVMHAIAGFDEDQVKDILGIDDSLTVITLIVCGKHADDPGSMLNEKQMESEKKRPHRFPLADFAFHESYGTT